MWDFDHNGSGPKEWGAFYDLSGLPFLANKPSKRT